MPKPLSNGAENSGDPQISSQGNNVYFVWEEETTSTSNNRDIFFASSDNSGEDFSLGHNLSNSTGDSETPQISSNTS